MMLTHFRYSLDYPSPFERNGISQTIDTGHTILDNLGVKCLYSDLFINKIKQCQKIIINNGYNNNNQILKYHLINVT